MTETRDSKPQDIENNIVHYADKLRAGLLDDDPTLKAQVETVLAANPGTEHFWQHVRRELEQLAASDSCVDSELKVRRREALQRAGRKKPRRATWPQLATATAFTIVVAVTAILLFGRYLLEPLTPATEEVALSSDPELEVLNANLDFYAWLDTQNSSAPDPR